MKKNESQPLKFDFGISDGGERFRHKAPPNLIFEFDRMCKLRNVYKNKLISKHVSLLYIKKNQKLLSDLPEVCHQIMCST